MKDKKLFSVFFPLILIFTEFCLPSSFQMEAAAQASLLTHQDVVNGFTVSYPANWSKQDNVYGTHGVQFSPNPAVRDNVLIDVVQQPGVTLDSWTQEKIGSINSRPGASILQLNPTTLGGNPAYKVEYSWEGDKILEIWAVIGQKLYAISYLAEGDDRYQQNLPSIQGIIDSFRLMTAGSPPVTSLATTTTTKTAPASPAKPNNDNGLKKYDSCPAGSANPEEGCTLEGNQCGPDGCGYYSHGICENCNDEERDDDNDDNDDNNNNEEETANCGGEPCTPTEKEDSWLDDETEYEDDGEIEGREDEDSGAGDDESSGGDENEGEGGN